MAALQNPEVQDRGEATPPADPENFETHIAEPHWQRVVTIVVILLVVGLWIWATAKH